MSDNNNNNNSNNSNDFNILVCIDGSEESFRGLHYAIKFGQDHPDTDIALLYVRTLGVGGRASGLNMELSRERLMDWDIEVSGLTSLKKARDMLVEGGFLDEDWKGEDVTKKFRGTRSGDQIIRYTSNRTQQHISLILREASSVLTGILNEAHFYNYDLVIVSTSSESAGGDGHIDMYTAIGVATEHDGTVILVRELEEQRGHLVCVEDTQVSMDMVRKDAILAQRCDCPIYLYAVALDKSKLKAAEHAVDEAEKIVREIGGNLIGKSAEVGEPVWRITEKGKQHSLIVISATEKSRLKQMFMGSVSHAILKKAKSSVMIMR